MLSIFLQMLFIMNLALKYSPGSLELKNLTINGDTRSLFSPLIKLDAIVNTGKRIIVCFAPAGCIKEPVFLISTCLPSATCLDIAAMRMSEVSLVVAVMMAIIFMSLQSAEAGKSSVDIINYSIGEPLQVHCKSGNDDLQLQLLQIGQDYHFEFHASFWMDTVFWCRFVWGANGKNWLAMEVWDREHAWEMPLLCGNCVWRAQPEGMYIWNKIHDTYDLWKIWNTNGPATFGNETDLGGIWETPRLDAQSGGN